MNVSKWKKAFTEKDTQLSFKKKKRFIKHSKFKWQTNK